jgi:hypothetical protein
VLLLPAAPPALLSEGPEALLCEGAAAFLWADPLPEVVVVLRPVPPADLLCDGFPDILLMLFLFQGANLQLINGFLPDLFRTFAVG